ncbi:efflux RND transporter permease subunit [Neomegalonema sp.]|uniref:efflux RND transporter permease subunit n=1 Tax=Neomegalonema sp. TaxID=2039713 RepID=UPI002611D833|nr:efflux RND transporter permease subunit [Neomegalonema sp.]MDD2869070.1 efflux RND transporter permease subunit [Neomegalonema sp.]
MKALIDAALDRARMMAVVILLSTIVGVVSYFSLPKEGNPNIEIPIVYVSIPYPGVTALDAERLLVRPLETKLRSMQGLSKLNSTAAEGYANVVLEFEIGLDMKTVLADVREEVNKAKASFPEGAKEPTVSEVNFSDFPVLVLSLFGDAPERALFRIASELQDVVEAVPQVLEATVVGKRDEMLEVLIDPVKLEAYNITAYELLNIVNNNNQIVAAGAIEAPSGSFSVKLPGAFETPQDVYGLPIKVNGDRVVTLGEVAELRSGFQDRSTLARYNGESSVSLQIKKRPGENIIDTVKAVRAAVDKATAAWPPALRQTVRAEFSQDQGAQIQIMVYQLEGTVLVAVFLVIVTMVASMGFNPAVLVGLSIPISFFLTFAFMSALGMEVNSMVMFGLLLSVGLVVDGATIVAEYADLEMAKGAEPVEAFREAAHRMVWPVISSTATTLCAFMPLLFWPGIAGQFMGYLPLTVFFVLAASLVVAMIYIPVIGANMQKATRAVSRFGRWLVGRFTLVGAAMLSAALLAASGALFLRLGSAASLQAAIALGIGFAVCAFFSALLLSALLGGLRRRKDDAPPLEAPRERRSLFAWFTWLIAGNPVMPLVVIGAAVFSLISIIQHFGENNYGMEFFVETDAEMAMVHVLARGNLSLEEKDALVRRVEARVQGFREIQSIFTSVGGGGGGSGFGGSTPADAIGTIQVEMRPAEEKWEGRRTGNQVLDEIRQRTADMPGLRVEVTAQEGGPSQGKPVQIEISGQNLDDMMASARRVREHLENEVSGLQEVDDTLPLPGVVWRLDVDRAAAGRFGADVASVGALVQLVTRGALIGVYRPEHADEEVEIRARFPESARDVDTLDDLRLRTATGLQPLSNFVTRSPEPRLSEVSRRDGQRIFTVRAGVAPGVNANEKIAEIQQWMTDSSPLSPGVSFAFRGDQEEQADTITFLISAFGIALGMMFMILLAQFNSLYNTMVVLSAVIFSVGGVLLGMMIMGQPFSIIMSGLGMVALAGVVVGNNIVLIDTYQQLEKEMPRVEAIVETASQRLRPVFLTTITTLTGLLPNMFAVSFDFRAKTLSVGDPSSLMWVQLSTAMVFGLAFATVLTLVVTPALLAARVWWGGHVPRFLGRVWTRARALATEGPRGPHMQEVALRRRLAEFKGPLIWEAAPGLAAAGAATSAPAPAAPPPAPPTALSRPVVPGAPVPLQKEAPEPPEQEPSGETEAEVYGPPPPPSWTRAAE